MKTQSPSVAEPKTSWLTPKKYRAVAIPLSLALMTIIGFMAIFIGVVNFEEGSSAYIFLVHGGTALVPVAFAHFCMIYCFAKPSYKKCEIALAKPTNRHKLGHHGISA